jgi:hypothetical protein
MKLVKDFDLEIKSQSFQDECELEVEVNMRTFESVLEKINLLSATGSTIRLVST